MQIHKNVSYTATNITSNALNMLQSVEAVGNDLSFSQCACVSSSGHLYVEVGQPTVKMKGINVYSKC
jgi:predicted Zn-dependent protease